MAAFRSSDYRFFFMGRVTSTFAVNMQTVAISWVVYVNTGSALNLGLIGLALFLPGLLLFLAAGAAADRFNRKRILIVAFWTQGTGSALLLYFSLTGVTDFSFYFAVAMLLGTGRTFANPTSNAILPNLVPRHHFANAVAWSSSGFQITKIVAPAAGGLLLIIGADVDFAVITCLFVLAAIVTGGIKGKTQSERRDPVNLETLFAGFRFIWSEKIILAVISIDLFAVFLGGAVALLPIYAKDILQVGEWGLGLLRSAPAWGAVVCGIYLTQRPIAHRAGVKMFVSVAIFGLATVAFGISENFIWTLVTLTVMGGADMVSVFIRQNIIQLSTPDEMRGRVNAVNSVFVGASNELGEFESGVTAEWWGTVPAVLVGGLGTLAIAAIWVQLFPSLRRVDGLDAESLARA